MNYFSYEINYQLLIKDWSNIIKFGLKNEDMKMEKKMIQIHSKKF